MRYLTMPPDAAVHDIPAVKGDTLSFREFFLHFAAPRFPIGTVAEVSTLGAVASKLAAADAGAVVELTPAEHKALQASLPPVQGELLVRLLAFYSAVAGAVEKAPVAVDKAPVAVAAPEA